MIKFFKNIFIKNVFLLIMFLLINILIFGLFVIFFTHSNLDNPYYNGISTSEIEEAIETGDTNYIDERITELNMFYFILDSNGNIINSTNLPKELNHNYSRVDIAQFTRWYLDDYPVLTKILNNGFLLVRGYPKGTLAKYSITLPIKAVFEDLLLFPMILLINLLIFIFLLYRNEKKTSKELVPILNSINELAHGKDIDMEETGKLKDLKVSLNILSNRLKKREEERKDWISGISHDIRTPLSVIATSSELIKTKDITYINRIKTNVIKIRELVEDLNLNNKLDYGNLNKENTRKNFTNIIRDSIVNFINENELEDRDLSINISEDCENIMVSLDSSLITRAISNLLINSLQHSPNNSFINIDLFKENNQLIFTIENSVKENEIFIAGQGLELVKKVIDFHNWNLIIDLDETFKVKIIVP